MARVAIGRLRRVSLRTLKTLEGHPLLYVYLVLDGPAVLVAGDVGDGAEGLGELDLLGVAAWPSAVEPFRQKATANDRKVSVQIPKE